MRGAGGLIVVSAAGEPFMSDLSDFVDDGPRSEIVQWFDDPVWKVQSVPTPIAFGFGLILGAAALALALKIMED